MFYHCAVTKRFWTQCFCLVGLVLAWFWAAPSAWACAICAPAGETTWVSRLAVARQVVLARSVGPPGEFVPVVAVKGPLPDAAAGPLRGVVDDRPALRAVDKRAPASLLAGAQPASDRLAVLSYSALTQRWMHIGELPRQRAAWLQKIAVLQPTAQVEAAGWPARLQFFLPDLENESPLVAQAAFEEVASAPYALMRQQLRAPGPGIKPSPLQLLAPRSMQLLTWLHNNDLAARHSLYYLLLGVAADPRSVDFLTQRLSQVVPTPIAGTPAAALSPADVSGLLAALIEIRGAAVLPWVEQHFLSHAAPISAQMTQDAQRTSMAMAQAAVLALGVQAAAGAATAQASGPVGSPAISTQQVVQVFASYIRRHPEMAGLVASDLASWGQWQFAESFAQTLQSGRFIPFASRYAMVFYLLRNPRAEAKTLVEKLRLAKAI